jgi:regulator of sirC expression with transglutaminase-like and TPR domain
VIPKTLPALFAREPAPSPELAALVLACDTDAGVDVAEWLTQLDEMALAVAAQIARCTTLHERVSVLGTHFCETLGFRGNEESYYDPRNSQLPWVIASRRGIPISLAVVYMAIANRAGVPTQGIGFPGHFLVRVGGDDGVLVDAFFGARVVTTSHLEDLSRRMLGGPGRVTEEHLRVVDARLIVVRMLTNLKGVYESGGDHSRAMIVCDRLVDLTGLPEHRRDRGRHAWAMGAPSVALEDFQTYLKERPDARDRAEVSTLLAQVREVLPRRVVQ